MIPTCEMDAAHAIEFVSLLLAGSLIFGTFIAAVVVSFLNAVAAFKRPVGPGEGGSN
jgi:hypothetical protein